ncbi:LysE family transporter [Leptolyngbya sp. FACHB-261]|nr:LysE family transporter [Leptolyngbya sp. FACHB-261]
MSPGPSFVLVARTAIASSRAHGLAAAAGMGLGGLLFSVLVLLGFHALLASVPWLYLVLKVVGGAYLFYLGICIWRGAKQPLAMAEASQPMPSKLGRSFLVALGAQLSNPKTAVFYGSIFAALLPQNLPVAVAVTLPALVFIIETAWYAVVALALSSESSRAAYLRAKVVVDRVAGGVLGLLGLKLIASGSATA